MEGQSHDCAAAHDHSNKIPISEWQEMAYLLLEDCCIEVMRDNVEAGPKLRQWIEVDQLRPSCDASEHLDGSSKENSKELDGQPLDGICRRCNLVLLQQTMGEVYSNTVSDDNHGSEVLQLDWGKVPVFNGTVSDVFSVNKALLPSPCSCGSSETKTKRSDAALLTGLLVACREQVRVVHCSVMFREENQASLLLTLAFPYLRQTAGTARRSILAQHHHSPSPSKRSRISSKPLYPALQLLLSLVRSDWNQLELAQHRLLDEVSSAEPLASRKKPSFFPSELTLGEIYSRAQCSKASSSYSADCKNEPRESDACRLTSLPLDLLVERMAPFLQAQSLAALRCTCTYLHRSLRGVVPGLKLRLYNHQVNSLSWMRRREASLIRTETYGFQSTEAQPDGDVHRAITGGATVRLVSKPMDNDARLCCIRVDPYTGREIAQEPEFDNGSLPRRVARGGLLCDDPGLGKTVSVLALILQTYGLSTAFDIESPPTTTPEAASRECTQSPDVPTEFRKQSEGDAIFQAYWAEQVVAEFRVPALLKLVNELSKRNRGGGFFPLDTIKKAIGNDAYGGDFSAFETAVQ
jgi:SNF2-related domain